MRQILFLLYFISISAFAQIDSIPGKALYFNGSSDFVDTEFKEHLKVFTVTCWVKSPNAPDFYEGKGPVHYEKNFQINWDHVNPDFQGACGLKDTSGWKAVNFDKLEANKWYYLACTYDGETLITYTNGELSNSDTSTSGFARQETNSIKVGKHAELSGPSYEFFNGTVDEVRVYDRVLSNTEIRESMHVINDTIDSNLKLYYQFNDTTHADSAFDAVRQIYTPIISKPFVKNSTAAVGKGFVHSFDSTNNPNNLSYDFQEVGVSFVPLSSDSLSGITISKINVDYVGQDLQDQNFQFGKSPYWIIHPHKGSKLAGSLLFNTSDVDLSKATFDDNSIRYFNRNATDESKWNLGIETNVPTNQDHSECTIGIFPKGQIMFGVDLTLKLDNLLSDKLILKRTLKAVYELHFKDNRIKKLEYDLYDLNGKTIISGKSKTPIVFDLNQIASGQYILKVNEKNTNFFRIIK